MEQRLANSLRLTVNEKKFIETALLSDLRIDGRRPFDYRNLTINFGKHDGSAEVQLGQTHVMAFVTAQLTQPYRDRPNEGSLSIFTEFSPMADPSFEPGRPGQSAVELGRVVDRGLRESRAVDTESLCVLSGKSVWAIRIDLHILDNGGNLVDAANVAALAALLTFRRPECSLGGEDGQEVAVHPPEEREPLPLIIHHLPIAVTFAFFGSESSVVIDPTHHEEAVMGGRMTTTLNANGDICAIQKAGGEGILQSVIMQCLRIASVKAGDITEKLKKAVDSYNTERALKKIKRHPSLTPMDVDGAHSNSREKQGPPVFKKATSEFPSHHTRKSNKLENVEGETNSSEQRNTTKNFIGGPSSWDPYSKGVDPDFLKASLASRGSTAISLIREKFYMLCFYDYLIYLNKCSWFFSKRKTFLFDLLLYREHAGASTASKKQEVSKNEKMHGLAKLEETAEDVNEGFLQVEAAQAEQPTRGEKTLKDAVKPKNKRKQKESSTGAS